MESHKSHVPNHQPDDLSMIGVYIYIMIGISMIYGYKLYIMVYKPTYK